MISSRPAARATAILAVAAALLGGCVSLLPKQKPVQLYRFGAEAPSPAQPPAASVPPFNVRQAELGFERAAAGDRILSVTGNEAAYLAGGRWLSSASTLYSQALDRAFIFYGSPARLITRGEPARADFTLKLEVRTFEVRYDHGVGAAPTVGVAIYAALDGMGAKPTQADRMFRADIPVAANRIADIAAAFDQAVNTINRDLVAWVGAKGQG